MSTIRFDLLRKAVAIINERPDYLIDLDRWECNSVNCAAGTIAHDPEFQELGFRLVPLRRLSDAEDIVMIPMFTDSEGVDQTSYNAIALLFGLTAIEALNLFTPRRAIESAYVGIQISDKQVWLNRVDHFFKQHGEDLNA